MSRVLARFSHLNTREREETRFFGFSNSIEKIEAEQQQASSEGRKRKNNHVLCTVVEIHTQTRTHTDTGKEGKSFLS